DRFDALDAERFDDGFDGHQGTVLSESRRSGQVVPDPSHATLAAPPHGAEAPARHPYGTFTDSRRSMGGFTAAVRASLSQGNLWPSAALFSVLSNPTENSWR